MRVLVTGATGFLGRHLCNALLARRDFVVAVLRDETGGWLSWGASSIVRGGLDTVERAIAEYEVEAVVHLAAQTQVSTAVNDPWGTFEANARGTVQVLEACRRQGVKRVVVASSDKVYGNGKVPYVEGQALEAGGIYATSKTCADLIAQSYAREFGMSITVTRCGNLYGPGHTNWSTLIPGTIRSVLRGERPRLRSTGGPKRDFLFVEDAVAAYLRLVESTETGAFNFGTGRGRSVMEVVDEILRQMGSELRPFICASVGVPGLPIEIEEQVLDCTRAANLIQWRPRHTFEEGLAKTIEWYRLHLEAL